MSAGALKRRSLFHGQRKRQKKTATLANNGRKSDSKTIKINLFGYSNKAGQKQHKKKQRKKEKSRRGSSGCGEGAGNANEKFLLSSSEVCRSSQLVSAVHKLPNHFLGSS